MDTLVIIKRIEMRLTQIGMSKAEFYSRSGISSASLSQWRTGTYKPSKKKLEKAAEVLAVPVGYLLGNVTMNDDGYSFSDGSGYGGGFASGAGYGDGSGFGGPILESDTAYDRAIELCSICVSNNKSFKDICIDAGLTEQGIRTWKEGTLPERDVLKRIADHLLVPLDFLLGEGNKEAPTETGERDILDEVDIGFYNGYKELTEDDKETIRDMVELMRARRAEKGK